MRVFLSVFLLCFMHVSQAITYTTKVHQIDYGDHVHDKVLVYFTNGRIARLISPHSQLLNELQSSRRKRHLLEVNVDENRFLLSFHQVEEKMKSLVHPFTGTKSFTPTILPSLLEAKEIFKDARNTRKESQCYNRAHVWAYEWRVKHNLYSSKAWLFFTRKYIRKFNFEWWFHVAPYFHLVDDGKVKELVADVKYGKTVLRFKSWTDIFMRNNAECPLVTKYSEQANYPESGWCFLMKTSMYYYQPLDLEALEKSGQVRLAWNADELSAAYLEAFDIDLNQGGGP